MKKSKVYINASLSAKSEKSKDKLQSKLLRELSCFSETQMDTIQGSNIKIVMYFESSSWSELIFELITLAQEFGRKWTLMGTIDFEFSIFSNDIIIPGIEFISIDCNNSFLSNPKGNKTK